MATYSKLPLSGSTDGRGIKITQTALGSAVTLHTATSDATLVDNITLFAYNSDTVPRILTVAWGGTTDPDDLIKTTLPSQAGLVLITADLVLRNSLVAKAVGDATNVIVVWGYVNRVS